MKQIIFVTGNSRKIQEAKLACEPAGITIIQKELYIDEIQSSNPQKVSLHKAKEAFKHFNKPLVVTDASWSIAALNGFPGAYMKDVVHWFSEQDFINLVADYKDKHISFSENITYIDEHTTKYFSREFTGQIVPPRGTGNSLENVAEFDGVTLGERRERGEVSHKPEDYVWNDFVEWFLRQPDTQTA